MVFGEFLKAFKDGWHIARPFFEEIAGFEGGFALSLHNHLRTGFAFGLEENGVHVNRCRNASGAGLQGLSAANFTTV